MARKLTPTERTNIDLIRDALLRVLPAPQRSLAAGVASALVRLPGERVSDKDLDRLLAKSGKDDRAVLRAAAVSEVLVPVEGEQGTYVLRVPAEEGAAETASGGEESDGAGESEPTQAASSDEIDGDMAPASDAPTLTATEESSAAAEDAAEAPESVAVGVSDAGAGGATAPAPLGPVAADAAPKGSSRQRGRSRRRQHADRDLKKVPYVRRGGENEAELRRKIVALDERFWMNGWLLSHPGAYELYEQELLAINNVLDDGMLPGDITRRQLAYQMGGDEKFFEYGSDGFRLLRAMGMEDVVRHRPVPKPDLVYYAPRRRKHMRVLVTENLDPYLDVHDLMYEDGRSLILGERIHAVVLGGGTPVVEHNRLALLLDTLRADSVTVLYWGDIDRAGLDLMVKLKAELGDKYTFRAFTPAYQLMVDRASERFPDPADNEVTGQGNIEAPDASLLTEGLTPEAASYAQAVIDGCGLIPQEILTKRDL